MKKVSVNINGYVLGPYFSDFDHEIEVSDEQFETLSRFPYEHNWRYFNNEWSLICLDEESFIRHKRETECFVIINRGQLWYDSLTAEQRNELTIWYKDWLNAPTTKIIPIKPKWLN